MTWWAIDVRADPSRREWVGAWLVARTGQAVEERADGTCYVGMLAVRPEAQARGLGRTMLAAAEAHARTAGARRLEMTVIAQRAELIAWYERHGFADTGERSPFPYGDARYGLPRRADLEFRHLARSLPDG